MLIFKKLGLSDIEIMKPYFLLSKNRACDNTVGGTFIWRDFFQMEYAAYKNNFIFKGKFFISNENENITVFAMPLGKNTEEITDSLKQIESYCKENKIPMIICLATGEDIEIIEMLYKNINKSEEIGWSDYLYKASDLSTLAGRKYSGQRNHINYFKRTYENYDIKQINAENIDDARNFFEGYKNRHDKNLPALIEEAEKILEMLESIENYRIYGQIGVVLYIDGAVAGFSIGEIINEILFVHIEKADLNYRGAYQIIVNEFVKQNININKNIIYVNREDDAGDENLKISKMSYHPCDIIKKYTVEIKF